MLTKRVIIATLLGVVCGILCYVGGRYILEVPGNYTLLHFINVMINRTLIGFVIGISALNMKWHTHGIIIGSIAGLPFLLHEWLIGMGPMILIAICFASGLFGIMIEFFTSRIFKLPVNSWRN